MRAPWAGWACLGRGGRGLDYWQQRRKQRRRLSSQSSLRQRIAELLLNQTERLRLRRPRAAGTTRLLVTHQRQYLPACDRILVMSRGRIVEEGTYAELAARGVADVIAVEGAL